MWRKIRQWFIEKAAKKQIVKDALNKKEETIKFAEKMKELYQFVKWLNLPQQVGNRSARKAFWIRVKNGEGLVEKQIERLLANFQDNVKKLDKIVKENK